MVALTLCEAALTLWHYMWGARASVRLCACVDTSERVWRELSNNAGRDEPAPPAAYTCRFINISDRIATNYCLAFDSRRRRLAPCASSLRLSTDAAASYRLITWTTALIATCNINYDTFIYVVSNFTWNVQRNKRPTQQLWCRYELKWLQNMSVFNLLIMPVAYKTLIIFFWTRKPSIMFNYIVYCHLCALWFLYISLYLWSDEFSKRRVEFTKRNGLVR